VQGLHGRVGFHVRQGDLVGVALADALKRMERRPLTASTEWRNGRTPFEHANLNLAIANGVAQIVESGFSAPNLNGSLQGRLSFLDRTIAARGLVDAPAQGPSPAPTFAFDIVGPWADIAIAPDARALLERSGVVRSLMPDVRINSVRPPTVRESAAQ